MSYPNAMLIMALVFKIFKSLPFNPLRALVCLLYLLRAKISFEYFSIKVSVVFILFEFEKVKLLNSTHLHFLNILCLLIVTIFSTFFSSKTNNLKAFN